LETAVHELAHHVDLSILSGWLFGERFSKRAQFDKGPRINKYARTNSMESFAEMFTAAHLNRALFACFANRSKRGARHDPRVRMIAKLMKLDDFDTGTAMELLKDR